MRSSSSRPVWGGVAIRGFIGVDVLWGWGEKEGVGGPGRTSEEKGRERGNHYRKGCQKAPVVGGEKAKAGRKEGTSTPRCITAG